MIYSFYNSMANTPHRACEYVNDASFSMLKSTYSHTNIYASTNPTTHIDTLYKRPKRRILIQTPNLKFQKISNQYHLHWSIPCLPPVCPGRYKYK